MIVLLSRHGLNARNPFIAMTVMYSNLHLGPATSGVVCGKAEPGGPMERHASACPNLDRNVVDEVLARHAKASAAKTRDIGQNTLHPISNSLRRSNSFNGSVSSLTSESGMPSLKRARTESWLEDQSENHTPIIRTTEDQSAFDRDLCKWLVANNIAFNVANNPETSLFFNKWVPGIKIHESRVYSGRILNELVAEDDAIVREKTNGRVGTAISDDWKSGSKKGLSLTMTRVEGQVLQ